MPTKIKTNRTNEKQLAYREPVLTAENENRDVKKRGLVEDA
jgi:hypothetical protein